MRAGMPDAREALSCRAMSHSQGDKHRLAIGLSLAARDENPGILLKALGDVAKARGMAEVAKAPSLVGRASTRR